MKTSNMNEKVAIEGYVGFEGKTLSDPSLSTFSGCNEKNCQCKLRTNQPYSMNTAYATVPYFPFTKLDMEDKNKNTKRFWSNDTSMNLYEYDKNIPRGYSIYTGWGNNNTIYPYELNGMNYQGMEQQENIEYDLTKTYPFRPLHPLDHLAGAHITNLSQPSSNTKTRKSTKPFCC